MEHFPSIADPYDPIKIPWLGGRYRGAATRFPSYLADHDPRFDLARLQNHEFESQDRGAVAQVLQSWLYFGLLSEALQLDVEENDFIRVDPESGCSLITTVELRAHLHRWREAHEQAKDDDPLVLEGRKRRTIEALYVSHQAWSGFNDFAAIVGPEIELSIQLLGCAIEHAVTCVYAGKEDKGVDTWISGTHAPWRQTSSQFVAERMRSMGWCPSIIRQLGQRFQLSNQTFASLLRPSFPQDTSQHADCKYEDAGCKRKNIHETTYETAHVESCACVDKDASAFLHVDMDELRQILRDGGIPIVQYQAGGDGVQPRLKLVKHQYELQYAAISHVWADGLGNPRANALPICQIQRIVEYLSHAIMMLVPRTPPAEYHDSIWKDDVWRSNDAPFTSDELRSRPYYFWMDTLCVPAQKVDYELRKAAIKNMRAIYKRANRVLVLDADLLATPGTPETLSHQEVLTRISASSWLRRYWTLQEALLARRLLFQFAETAFYIIDHPKGVGNIFLHYYDNEVGYYANDNIEFTTRSQTLRNTEHERVAAIWSRLGGRVASHAGDEPICVATMLDKDLQPLLDIEDKTARIGQLWRMYSEFPLGVLCRPAEKLDDQEQPWAFANMADCAVIPMPNFVTVRHQEGRLKFRHHGLILAEPLRQTPTSLIAVAIDEKVYFVRENTKSSNRSWAGIDFTCATLRFAVVLAQDAPGPIDGCLGALVSVTMQGDKVMADDGLLEGRYLRAVSVVRKGSNFDVGHGGTQPATVQSERDLVYRAAWLGAEQKWEVHG